MLNGRIVEQGAYDELMGRGGELKSILEAADIGDTLSRTNNPTTAVKKPQSPTGRSAAASSTAPDGASKTVGKLISSEERATGQIGVRVYLEYAKLIGGYWVVAVLAMVMILAQGSRIITDLWLNIWATGQLGWTTGNYQGMYAGLGMIQVLLMVSIGLMFSAASVVACRRIHRLALERVLASPIAWFDSQPLGRLINRFSRDMDTMDSLIPESVRVFCYTISMTISLLLTICVALWLFIIPLVPVLLIYWYTQHFYRRTSIDLKRLDNVSRSPLFAQISETFVGSGQSTIRAYNAQQRFIAKNLAMLDYNNRSYYLTILTQRWLSLRLETLASLLTFFAALFGVIGKDSLDPGLIGIALTYSLQVTFVFNWAVRQSTEVEMYMNSLERLMHYVYELEDENVDGHQAVAVNNNNNTSEGIPLKTISIIPDSDWPRSGNIKFNEVSLRYRPDLPDVLQQVTLTINDGEKVGIVGRTG
jgi:ATP-binding cassette subfamily C (CFTR/MRP) protein 1